MAQVFRILGSGSSGGVPRIHGDWGICDPENPRNRRTRCSLLVSQTSGSGQTQVLIDTSPDMRQQLIDVMDDTQDSLRFYFMGANWQKKVEHVGAKDAVDLEGPLIF